MSGDRDAVDIAVLQTEMRALLTEVSNLRKDVDNLKAWRQWTIGGAFVITLLINTFLPDIKAAIAGR